MVESVYLIKQPILLMYKIVNFFFIAASQFQHLLLLSVQIFIDAIDHSLFHIDYFIESFSLGFEGVGQVLDLLIFHQIFGRPLILDFLGFGSMQSFNIFDLFVLFVYRLV